MPNYPSIVLRGFNITPGATWIDEEDDRIWIATSKVIRNAEHEVVHVIARRGDAEFGQQSFTFGYCDTVQYIGHVVNPNDEDDKDFGAEMIDDMPDPIDQLFNKNAVIFTPHVARVVADRIKSGAAIMSMQTADVYKQLRRIADGE